MPRFVFMIELVIKIDCEKTERALNAVSVIMETDKMVLIKDWLKLNELLYKTAEAIKDDPALHEGLIKKYGKNNVVDLMGILKRQLQTINAIPDSSK